MDARRRFLRDLFTSDDPLTVVARRHGVTRQTGAKWRDRALEFGLEGLAERSRAPRNRPNATRPKMVEMVVELRLKHPRWGPEKLRTLLERDYPGMDLPAVSTIGAILKRKGLVLPRRRRGPGGKPPPSSLGAQDRPNQSWSMDHKGDFLLGSGQRCYPFTLIDAASRFLLALEAFPSTRGDLAKKALTKAFKEHGLPEAVRSDNGSPFASASFTGLTELAVWLVQLGIRLDRIEPGKPQQNGRLERYHRTVKAACCKPPKPTMRSQQKAFDVHRAEYNDVRPHKSLDQRTPASVYEASPREFPSRILPPDYGAAPARKVTKAGWAAFEGWRIPLGSMLYRRSVGFFPEGDVFEVRFYDRVLGRFSPKTGTIENGSVVRCCRRRSDWK